MIAINHYLRLAEKNQGAFVPFVTVTILTSEQSLKIMGNLGWSGADALELGIHSQDPLRRCHPTIQGANIRALDSKVTPDVCFDLIGQIK